MYQNKVSTCINNGIYYIKYVQKTMILWHVKNVKVQDIFWV